MNKQKKFILIPLILIAALLMYCWTAILTTDILGTWKHYVGLVSFIVLAILFYKNIRKAAIGTGVYLLLATFNGLAITAEVNTNWIRIGPVSTPEIQLLSLGLFILYFCLNMNFLFDIYLDHQEAKKNNSQNG